ncbi:MAG: hypothetical protein IT422_06575 [Pirellulaceae bacterium]|nr:hypothetical protein [Pirellulaceae bacterium]
MHERLWGVWLAAAGAIISWQPQVPSPAQAAKVGVGDTGYGGGIARAV